MFEEPVMEVAEYNDTQRSLVKQYNENYAPDSSADGFSASAYDAARLVLQAAKNVGTNDAKALAAEMLTVPIEPVSGKSMEFQDGKADGFPLQRGFRGFCGE